MALRQRLAGLRFQQRGGVPQNIPSEEDITNIRLEQAGLRPQPRPAPPVTARDEFSQLLPAARENIVGLRDALAELGRTLWRRFPRGQDPFGPEPPVDTSAEGIGRMLADFVIPRFESEEEMQAFFASPLGTIAGAFPPAGPAAQALSGAFRNVGQLLRLARTTAPVAPTIARVTAGQAAEAALRGTARVAQAAPVNLPSGLTSARIRRFLKPEIQTQYEAARQRVERKTAMG